MTPDEFLEELHLCIQYQFPKEMVYVRWDLCMDWWIIK